jgi:phosphoglycolate phosphatase
MPAPLLVFDLDGTLADTAPDLLATLRAVLAKYGYPTDPDPGLRDGIGHGARFLIEHALKKRGADVSSAILDAMHRDFLDHYESNICVETCLFPGVAELLQRFGAAGWNFAVCTNKPESFSRLLLEGLGLDRHFAAICGGDTFAFRKPHPAHLIGTIQAAGGRPEAAVMIGDSRTDADAARNAGIPFAGVTFGYTPTPMAELGPDLLLHSYDEFTISAARRLLTTFARKIERSAAEPRALDFAEFATYSIANPVAQGA